jgi:hypothetical protein
MAPVMRRLKYMYPQQDFLARQIGITQFGEVPNCDFYIHSADGLDSIGTLVTLLTENNTHGYAEHSLFADSIVELSREVPDDFFESMVRYWLVLKEPNINLGEDEKPYIDDKVIRMFLIHNAALTKKGLAILNDPDNHSGLCLVRPQALLLPEIDISLRGKVVNAKIEEISRALLLKDSDYNQFVVM